MTMSILTSSKSPRVQISSLGHWHEEACLTTVPRSISLCRGKTGRNFELFFRNSISKFRICDKKLKVPFRIQRYRFFLKRNQRWDRGKVFHPRPGFAEVIKKERKKMAGSYCEKRFWKRKLLCRATRAANLCFQRVFVFWTVRDSRHRKNSFETFRGIPVADFQTSSLSPTLFRQHNHMRSKSLTAKQSWLICTSELTKVEALNSVQLVELLEFHLNVFLPSATQN